jgi:tRNA(Arg) A34 adenosine deaminase TadA
MDDERRFLDQAVALARQNMANGGRPFGAVVVRDGEVLATGVNGTYITCDPTDHAEMTALRAASRRLKSPDLGGSVVYASGHPCPMCMVAMRLAGVAGVVYAHSNEDGAPHGLSNAHLYDEMTNPFVDLPIRISHRPAADQASLYAEWRRRQSPEGA